MDSEQAGEGRERAIDGNPNTYWHTQYSPASPGHPHEIVVDLGQGEDIAGILVTPRQNQTNGRIETFELFVSADGKEWGTPVASGKLQNSTEQQRVLFSAPAPGRFVRLVAVDEVSGEAWTSLAELDVLVTAGDAA